MRKRLGGLALKVMFESLARAGRYSPLGRAQLENVRVQKNVAYGPRRPEHLLDIYGEGGPPLLYIHGGAFRILSKDTHWLMGATLARAGFTVYNINYRLAPKHPFPAALEDVGLAYEWLTQHHDCSQLVVAGESAGANLTLALGLAACFRRPELPRVFDTGVVPKALAPMCGILQVSNAARFARKKRLRRIVSDRIVEMENGYLGGQSLDPLSLSDPLLLLESEVAQQRPIPPMYAAVGTADPLLDDTRRLEAALRKRNISHKIEFYEKELHAFHAFAWRPAAQRCWQAQIEFLHENIAAPRDRQ